MYSFGQMACGLSALVVAALLLVPSRPVYAVTIDWVTVGVPGNAADDTTYGAVTDSFRIMKFEWTNSQYVDFLNAVDPSGTNPNSIYSLSMGINARGGISFTSGASMGTTYAARTDMGDKPVNDVSWFDAARVANWLMNGATGTSSTETGAYTLSGGTSGNAPAVNPGATVSMPTENQWYKAAYDKGGSTNAGYGDYAMQSDTAPTAVTADSTGNGSAGSIGNFANYNGAASWNSQTGNVTTAGTNGGASAYGAFDMSGNVFEWNDLTGAAGVSRGLRGGSWNSDAFYLSASYRGTIDPSVEDVTVGFRLASPFPVPEPSTWLMGAVGIACAGGGAVWRRKQACRASANVIPTRGEQVTITGLLFTVFSRPLNSPPAPAPLSASGQHCHLPTSNKRLLDQPTNIVRKPTAVEARMWRPQ